MDADVACLGFHKFYPGYNARGLGVSVCQLIKVALVTVFWLIIFLFKMYDTAGCNEFLCKGILGKHLHN